MASRRDFLKGAVGSGIAYGSLPLLGGMQVSEGKPSDVVRLSSKRQLFIDDYLIERMDGVRRILHRAEKHPGNPILRADHPWEKAVFINSGGPAVIWDPEDKIYKMLYTTYAVSGGVEGYSESYIPSYATSKDGIHWERPILGLVEYAGNSQNNLLPWPSQIPDGCNNFIYDLHDPDPARRYKSVYYAGWPTMQITGATKVSLSWNFHTHPHTGWGLFIAFSPDAIRWDVFSGNPIFNSRIVSDGNSLLGWDERRQKYIASFRPQFGQNLPLKVRVIALSESSDFMHWTDPREHIVLMPDARDPKGTEFYLVAMMFYEGIYIGLLWIYHNDPHWPWPKGSVITDNMLSRHQQTMDTQLATSRDLMHWERACNRETLIELGPLGSWDDGMIFASTPLIVGDEIWAYYGGTNMRHTHESLANVGKVVGGKLRTGGVGLAKWRLDGFVSVEAGLHEGTLLTRPFSFSGDQLWLNCDASKGSVAVEVLGETGRPVAGFTRSEAVPLESNGIRQRVRWLSNASLGSLEGKPIRLKFYMRSAQLYSFRIS